MSVTVANGTNFPINTCLSLGFNYDWRNQIPPNRYVVMTQFVDATLYARFCFDQSSLYDSSATSIGLFFLGTVVSVGAIVGGAIGCFVTGGTGVPFILSVGAIYLGAFAEVIGGISITAADLQKTQGSQPGVKVYQNKIFLITGEVEAGKPKNNIAEVWVKKQLALRELSVAEFEQMKARGLTEQRQDERENEAVENEFFQDKYHLGTPGRTGMSAREIVSNDLLGGNVWIYPSFAGIPEVTPDCWGSQGSENREIALSAKNKSLEFRIIPVDQRKVLAYDPKTVDPKIVNAPVQAYNIYSPSLDRYVTVRDVSNGLRLGGDAIELQKHPKPDSPEAKLHVNTNGQSLFFIIRSLNCYVFVPISRQAREASGVLQLPALVNQNGGIGQGTPVVVGDRTGPHPGWARWVVERTNLDEVRPLTLPEIDALSVGSPSGEKLIGGPVRIFPAYVRRHALQEHEHPLLWEIAHDSKDEGAVIQLTGRDDPAAQWVIEPNSMYDHSGGPPQVFKIRRAGLIDNRIQHAIVSEDGRYLVASTWTNPVPIYIKYSMGFFSFFVKTGKGWEDIWVDSFSNQARLRVGGLPGAERERNLWQVIATSSYIAERERWKSS